MTLPGGQSRPAEFRSTEDGPVSRHELEVRYGRGEAYGLAAIRSTTATWSVVRTTRSRAGSTCSETRRKCSSTARTARYWASVTYTGVVQPRRLHSHTKPIESGDSPVPSSSWIRSFTSRKSSAFFRARSSLGTRAI